MPYCHECGTEAVEDARYCPNCGSGLATDEADPSPTAEPELPPSDDLRQAGQLEEELTRGDRNIAVLCHLSAIAGFVFPFGNVIAPLIIWLMKREESLFIDDHGKEAVNFQISVWIYLIASGILVLIAIGIPLLSAVILFAVILFAIVAVITAAVRASRGQEYRYPLAIRLLK